MRKLQIQSRLPQIKDIDIDQPISSSFNATYLLEPEDPMFVQIGNAFVEEYTKGLL